MEYPEIRDEDLRAKLEEHRGNLMFGIMAQNLVFQQKKRDEEAVAANARSAHLATLPRDMRRRAIIREVIESEGASPDQLRFMPTPLAICGLPYRRLPEGTDEYIREQGRMRVVVSPGKVTDPNGKRITQPIPWGPKARLIMAHLSTEALRNRSPIIETSASLTSFMRDLGFDSRGGERGNIQPFKDQLQALAACRMEIAAWNGKTSATVDVKPFSKMQLWFSENAEQRSLWPTTIQFSDEFYTQLERHALPVDVRALRAFSNSARKLDLLFWITYRITRLETKLVLDWKPLKEQFGEGFHRDRDFRAQLADDLKSVLELFPKLPVKLSERGLEMDAADARALAIPARAIKPRKT
jgi:Plasmid encoded RepA protein